MPNPLYFFEQIPQDRHYPTHGFANLATVTNDPAARLKPLTNMAPIVYASPFKQSVSTTITPSQSSKWFFHAWPQQLLE